MDVILCAIGESLRVPPEAAMAFCGLDSDVPWNGSGGSRSSGRIEPAAAWCRPSRCSADKGSGREYRFFRSEELRSRIIWNLHGE